MYSRTDRDINITGVVVLHDPIYSDHDPKPYEPRHVISNNVAF